jgi:hypothetical protein
MRGDYRKARIPKSPYTQKPLYRKAHIPKSPYTQKPSINQVLGWTTQFCLRFGAHNPNLTLVRGLGYYNPIYDPVLGPITPIWTLFRVIQTRLWPLQTPNFDECDKYWVILTPFWGPWPKFDPCLGFRVFQSNLWPRFGPDNPNLDPVLGPYNPKMTTGNT